MPIRAKVRSFRDRRIDLPIPDGALVLDVGSGDKPSWRADVLLDGYPGDDFAGQRSGSGQARVTRPLFVADAANMPFVDHAFDYVICSHVLEHVPDPAAVIGELTRVAKAGYIEVPEAASSKIIDFPSHLWWCRLDESASPPELVFAAKTEPWFDAEIHEYLTRTGLDRKVKRLLDAHFHHNFVGVHWRGSVPFRVEGELAPDLVEAVVHADSEHHGAETLAGRVLTKVCSGRGHAPARPRHDDLVKPHFRRGDDARLEPRIYTFT